MNIILQYLFILRIDKKINQLLKNQFDDWLIFEEN
jgi:hypothetical protein